MTYIKYLILISIIIKFFFPTVLYACKHTPYSNDDHLLYKKYLSAKKKMKNNHYQNAIKKLEDLNRKYPFNPYSNQIYLDLIYAYYKSMDFILTKKTIKEFIKFNPTHPNMDYPLYIYGLTNMELDNNYHLLINRLFKLKKIEHNPLYAHKAFNNFSKLINQYPQSKYIKDAQKRLIYLKNRIAEYELSIIEYYSKKKAYITVINRTEYMLKYFPDTQATRKSLLYMNKAYQKLNLIEQANKVMKIIIHNQC